MAKKITGFTAERMKMIEDKTVVKGSVNKSGDLILSTRDGGQINAGSVIGKSINVLGSRTSPPTPDMGRPNDAYFVNKHMYIKLESGVWVDVGDFSGPKGDRGATGLKGDTGPVGPAGAIGPAGPKGDSGLDLIDIGKGKDLDDYKTPGVYKQTANVNTAEKNGGKNYPIGLAGYLTVYSSGQGSTSWVLQKYTDYLAKETYVRSLYNRTWSSWIPASGDKPKPIAYIPEYSEYVSEEDIGNTGYEYWFTKQGNVVIVSFENIRRVTIKIPKGFTPNAKTVSMVYVSDVYHAANDPKFDNVYQENAFMTVAAIREDDGKGYIQFGSEFYETGQFQIIEKIFSEGVNVMGQLVYFTDE